MLFLVVVVGGGTASDSSADAVEPDLSPSSDAADAVGAYAVSCPQGFGDLLDAKYFEVFGLWQSRYGRDNLRLSAHFRGIFQDRIAPHLDEALETCPAFVLETMMNSVLQIETEEGVPAARAWLLYIYQLRDRAMVFASEENRGRLDTLASEWADDIAVVYPKMLDLQRLGPFSEFRRDTTSSSDESLASQDQETESDFCFQQRFYVYELDPQSYEPGTLYCLQGQWGTEVVMRQYLKHTCNTKDPEAADWFYVPLYATCRYVKLNENVTDEAEMMMDMDAISSKFIWDPLLQFLRASKYYHRKHGSDHIFLFADGQGPRIWDSYDILRGESVFLSPEAKCPTWGEPIRRYLDVKPCLSSWKDIVIPGHTDYARIQYMRNQNRPTEERRLLMTFHGRSPGAHGAYGDCAVRGKVMEMARYGPHVDVGGFVEDYLERKGDAHFCLVPAGTSPWTNHLYESTFAGCIPVVISDEYEVAFADDIDWPSFSVKWPEAEVGAKLYEYLESLVTYFPQKVALMKRNVELNACWFNWYSTDARCSPYLLIQRRLRRLLDMRRSKPRFWNFGTELSEGGAGEPPLVFAHLQRPTRFKHFDNESSSFVYLSSSKP